MFRQLLAIGTIVAIVPAVAQADDKLELGSSVVAASDSESVTSEHPGVAVAATSWFGHFGAVVEAGHQPWAWGSSSTSFALGARITPASSPRTICDRSCISVRPWFELGAAREMWTFDEQQGSSWRTTERAGLGLDVLGSSSVGGTLWFRVQHANERPSVMSAFGEFHQPYETSLVVGAGLFFTAL